MTAAISAPVPLTELSRQEVLDQLRSFKTFVETRYRATLLGIFGSFARGEQTGRSDLDILVRFERGATLLHLSGLNVFLQEKLGCKIDLADINHLKPAYKPFILKDLVNI